MIVCDAFGHLYTTDDIDELVSFSLELKLKPGWNHCSKWFPHWDLTTKNKMNLAWKLGAHKPSSHKENADLIYDAESYAYSLRKWLVPSLIDGKGIAGQAIKRVDYEKFYSLREVDK